MSGPQPEIVRVAAGALLAALVVVALHVGRPILLPIVTAIVVTLILIRAADALGRVPLVGALPGMVRRFLVLAVVCAFGLLLGLLVADMVDRIAVQLPAYEANIEALIAALADRFGLDHAELWPAIYRSLQDVVDLQRFGLVLVGSASNLVWTFVLVGIYAGFLIAERGNFERKLVHAIGDETRALRVRQVMHRVGDSVGQYLGTKTLVNLILAVPSYVILRAFGVDFALFWAVLIGLVNYIPYVGSVLGVFFPAILSLGQFGSIGYSLALTVALSIPQMVVGNVLDPWLMGRRVNLSPFVVIVSLVIWGALWGIPGAILAVPMTAAIAIACAAFPSLRPVAVLLSSGDGSDVMAAPSPADGPPAGA